MVARFESRIKAFSIDISLLTILFLLINNFFRNFEEKILIAFIIYFTTNILPIFIKGGQTFGKRIQGIKIVNIDGTDASLGKILLREFFKGITSILTFGIYSVVAVFTLSEEKGQTIHDYLFKSKVIQLKRTK